MISSQPIARRKLSDHVEERLLAHIRNGELTPGDLLPSERQLMDAFGVGRVAVREAMQSLQRKGLIEIRHGGRPRVASPTFESVIGNLSETMHHMLAHSQSNFVYFKDARAVFEMEMARIAARERRAVDVARLREIIGMQDRTKAEREVWRRKVREDDGDAVQTVYDEFLHLDGLFHKAIAASSGNPVLETLCGALFDWLARFHIDVARNPGLERLTLAEHVEIVDAIEAGEPDRAADSMRAHLERAHGLYRPENVQKQPGPEQ